MPGSADAESTDPQSGVLDAVVGARHLRKLDPEPHLLAATDPRPVIESHCVARV
jgi:hypothetical protein